MNQDTPVREPRSTRRRFGAAALLLLPVLAGCGGSEAAEEALVFSAIPDDNKTELKERYEKVAAHLEEELGVPVVFEPTTSYDASVEAFKNGDIQLAWFGGVSGVQAREAVDGARAIAQGKVDPEFKSYFIAHADTGIEPSESFPMEMEGKTFTFGSPSSTSGRLMPEYHVRKETGRAPSKFFAGDENRFSGSHDQTALDVATGTVQCGALNYKVYESMVRDGEIDPAVCVRVWTTPPYPDYNWTAHPLLEERFGAGFVDRLQEALVGMSDPELLAAMQREEGLIPAGNEDFTAIEETMRGIGMLR